MDESEREEARAIVEAVRQGPPSYDPERLRTLRLADLLLRAVDEITRLEGVRAHDDR